MILLLFRMMGLVRQLTKELKDEDDSDLSSSDLSETEESESDEDD